MLRLIFLTLTSLAAAGYYQGQDSGEPLAVQLAPTIDKASAALKQFAADRVAPSIETTSIQTPKIRILGADALDPQALPALIARDQNRVIQYTPGGGTAYGWRSAAGDDFYRMHSSH